MGKSHWDPSGSNSYNESGNGEKAKKGGNYDYYQLSYFLDHDCDPKAMKKWFNSIAEGLENYIELIETYTILESVTEKEYKEAIKTVKKCIESLKKGSLKYLDVDRVNMIYESGGYIMMSEDYPD